MKPGKLAARLFRLLVGLAVVSVIVVFDWYPLIRELGGLRRQQSDLKRKTAEHNALSARFVFPDAPEQALLGGSDDDLLRSLPLAEREGAWAALVISELRARAVEDGIGSALGLFAPPRADLEDIAKGGDTLLVDWINGRQASAISEAFAIAADSNRTSWRGTFAGLPLGPGRRLASRPLAIVLSAPLPALLDFVNHVSWGTTRLEIVRLHLEPGARPSRAWMVVRGHFLSAHPSAWEPDRLKGPGDDLLIDPDSPLLEQRVVPRR